MDARPPPQQLGQPASRLSRAVPHSHPTPVPFSSPMFHCLRRSCPGCVAFLPAMMPLQGLQVCLCLAFACQTEETWSFAFERTLPQHRVVRLSPPSERLPSLSQLSPRCRPLSLVRGAPVCRPPSCRPEGRVAPSTRQTAVPDLGLCECAGRHRMGVPGPGRAARWLQGWPLLFQRAQEVSVSLFSSVLSRRDTHGDVH